ncbi:MAG: agmatine deiminase family protein [Lentimicrobiaceae bacterium]|jgi:agmatine/peptidylarginine deiminase|nr:agmatine deiminase family protein [Lentimicrobiaceae bacterium]
MTKRLFFISTLILLCSTFIFAQEAQKKPDWRKLHYLSEEEMYMPIEHAVNFVETDPPEGGGRMVAEFEPMQAVLIRYPFGIPMSVIIEMAKDLHVITIVSSSSQQTTVLNQYTNNGVNTANCSFLIANSDSYWVRDYGPWFVFDGNKQPGIVDFVYDRNRPNDNLIPEKIAPHLGVDLYGMNLIHTGGNMMVDGRGMAASTDLVYDENTNHADVLEKVNDYLGVTRYDVTIDPLGDYIKHIDCWGKYLAPDKILIAEIPQSDPRYQDYEDVANYFATTNCSYGYPYQVYRVFEPGNYQVTPYTNSIILNHKVLVPVSGTQYDAAALEVYREAMPGYEIIGITWNDWLNSDALHCRSKGIADLGMLFIDHRPLFGEQTKQDSIAITSKIIAYSGEDFVSDSVLVFYSINGGAYQTAPMSESGTDQFTGYIKGFDSEDEISYYVFAKDESGRRLTQPYMNVLDPHRFTMEYWENEDYYLTISHDTLWFEQATQTQSFFIGNETTTEITINTIKENAVPEYLEISLVEGINVTPIEAVLPLTILPNERVEIQIKITDLFPAKDYVANKILIGTDWEEATVVAMIHEDIISLPEPDAKIAYKLYPNPFEETVRFELQLESKQMVTIELFNVQGQQVHSMQQQLEAGNNTMNLDMSRFRQSIYFCRIVAGNKTGYSKLIRK